VKDYLAAARAGCANGVCRWVGGVAYGLLLLVFLSMGCDRRPELADEPVPLAEADAVLRQMIDTYQRAQTYADQGIVRLRYRDEGQWIEDQARLAVRLERPNRLIVRAYQLTIVCDGVSWHTHIADPETGDLDGQILARPAPEQLSLQDVYIDPISKEVIAGGMGGPPLTLELLLSEHSLEHLFQDSVRRELLTDQPIASQMCRRVRATLEEGSIIFWIDSQTHLLRRLEYPTDLLAQQLDPEGLIEDLSLVAEFRQASVNIDWGRNDFAMPIAADAKIVSRFVLPPRPLPSDLLGQVPDPFRFVGLDSQPWTQSSLKGRTCVLVWFNIHPASELCLRHVTNIQGEIGHDPTMIFLAVCTEPTSVGNQQLGRLAEDWGLTMPVVRDLEAYGRDIFQIPGAPTVVVLNAQGVVQAFEVGANPTLEDSLSAVIRQVIAGQSPASALVAHFQEQQQHYHQALLEVMHPALLRDAGRSRDLR
jgi:hypothetical protein